MNKGEMLGNMIVLATNAHAGQFDKGGQPYILHPLTVMHYLKNDDEELMCIALGHDVCEDTDVTFEDLRSAGMSERVIAGIDALTKMPGQTLRQYHTSIMDNYDAILVKLADIRHNCDVRRLKGLTDRDFARMEQYHKLYAELEEIKADYDLGGHYGEWSLDVPGEPPQIPSWRIKDEDDFPF